jgi:hypothetical protein
MNAEVNWDAFWKKARQVEQTLDYDFDVLADEAINVAFDLMLHTGVIHAPGGVQITADQFETLRNEIQSWIQLALTFSGLWANGTEINEPAPEPKLEHRAGFRFSWQCPSHSDKFYAATEEALEAAIEYHECLFHGIPLAA